MRRLYVKAVQSLPCRHARPRAGASKTRLERQVNLARGTWHTLDRLHFAHASTSTPLGARGNTRAHTHTPTLTCRVSAARSPVQSLSSHHFSAHTSLLVLAACRSMVASSTAQHSKTPAVRAIFAVSLPSHCSQGNPTTATSAGFLKTVMSPSEARSCSLALDAKDAV